MATSFFLTPLGILSLYPFQTTSECLPWPLAIYSHLQFPQPSSLFPPGSPGHLSTLRPDPLTFPSVVLTLDPHLSLGLPDLPFPLQHLPQFLQSFLLFPLPLLVPQTSPRPLPPPPDFLALFPFPRLQSTFWLVP